MKRADTFNRMVFGQWSGPNSPSALWNPYVLSDAVPLGWKWRLLAASLQSTFGAGNQFLYLYAIPPQLARLISNIRVSDDGSFFSGNPNLFNAAPVRAAVQISTGSATVQTNEASQVPQESVNVMMASRMFGRAITVPPGWALLGLQNPPSGGGTGFLTLRVVALQLPLRGAL